MLRRRKRGNVAIPWAAALYVFRKLAPVVIDKAPELLKALERRRATRAQIDPSVDPSLALFQERIDSQEQLLKAQTELIVELQASLNSTRRSLRLAWIILAATLLLTALSVFGVFAPA